MPVNKFRVRQLHRWMAPLMAFPLVLTLVTGIGFQMAIAAGQGNTFLWLLDWHRGKFGRLNLEMVYPYLNGLGLLTLVITGLLMWWQTSSRRRSPRRS
jgi:hypothetical protein